MKKSLVVAAIIAAVSACGSESGPTSGLATEIVLRAPDRNVQAVTADQLEVQVEIDGTSYDLQRSDLEWRGALDLPTGRELPLSVLWLFDGLQIASFDTTIGPIVDIDSLTVRPEDYITVGNAFDADSDGVSNLQELIDCTGPKDSSNVSFTIPQVGVGAISINGDSGVTWASVVTRDLCGELPPIDNLMIDRGAGLPDGQTGFYWQAAHDGESLYLIVYAEDASSATPFGDSMILSRDDSIHIFIDGDNSKSDTYDGVNDFHITIPMMRLAAPVTESGDQLVLYPNENLIEDEIGDISIQNSEGLTEILPFTDEVNVANSDENPANRIFLGPLRERLVDNVSYHNGTNHQPLVYEVRIPLDALDISVGQPFGFEIQIDDDVDGGDKEARYGWKHPSKLPDGPDVNNTVNNPSFMGTVILE